MISRFSSEANSVITSPLMSKSLVGRAVSNSVIYSELIMFLVAARAAPSPAPVPKAHSKSRLEIISGAF